MHIRLSMLLLLLSSAVCALAQQPTLNIDNISVTERNVSTTAVFRLRLNSPAPGPVSVRYSTLDGTAVAGVDYQAASGTLVFAPGEITRELRVTVNGDTTIEDDETFLMRLADPSGVTLARSSATATIVNDDFPPSPFSFGSDMRVYEGDAGTREAAFKVRLATAASSPIQVTVQSKFGSATPGVDFEPFAHAATFAPGMTELELHVKIIGDTVIEDEERFEIVLFHDGVERASGSFRILDDDRNVTISVSDVTLIEPDALAAIATFEITLSKPSPDIIRVYYRTMADTAAANEDYTPTSGQLVFPPGTTSRTVAVTVRGDLAREDAETFRVELFDPLAATVSDGVGVCTIVDNDGARRRRAARH